MSYFVYNMKKLPTVNKLNKLKEELRERLSRERTKIKNLRAEFEKKKNEKLTKKIRENIKTL